MASELSFIDSPFTTKVEYEAYVRGEQPLPAPMEEAAPDGLQDLSAMSLSHAEAWGPLEYPPARRTALKVSFDGLSADSGGRLSLRGVHTLLFTEGERAEYGFDNFDEDLQVCCEWLLHTSPPTSLLARRACFPRPGNDGWQVQGRHELGRRTQVHGRQPLSRSYVLRRGAARSADGARRARPQCDGQPRGRGRVCDSRAHPPIV